MSTEDREGRDTASQTGLNWWHPLLSDGGKKTWYEYRWSKGQDGERKQNRDTAFADRPSLSYSHSDIISDF